MTVEEFTRDLWEAMRSEAREQIGDGVTDEEFDRHVPPWDQLPASVRETKKTLIRDEHLKVLDRAGYLVVKKKGGQ